MFVVYFRALFRWFEGFILICICASSICLALEDPVNEDAPINQQLAIADYIFTAIFTVEMTIKMIALGVFMHKGAYVELHHAVSHVTLTLLCVGCSFDHIAYSYLWKHVVLRQIVIYSSITTVINT